MARSDALQLDDVGASEVLGQLEDRLSNGRPLLTELAGIIEQGSAEQYATGRGWAKLQQDYAARKAREGHGTRTMVYSGALLKSLTDSAARGATLTYDSDSVRRGSTLIQAVVRRGKRDPLRLDLAVLNERAEQAAVGFLTGER